MRHARGAAITALRFSMAAEGADRGGRGGAANVALLGEDLARWPTEKRLTALAMMVHCADLGNPGKPLRLSLDWSARISREFFAQGDAERTAGLPVSRGCDREDTDIGASQVRGAARPRASVEPLRRRSLPLPLR